MDHAATGVSRAALQDNCRDAVGRLAALLGIEGDADSLATLAFLADSVDYQLDWAQGEQVAGMGAHPDGAEPPGLAHALAHVGSCRTLGGT